MQWEVQANIIGNKSSYLVYSGNLISRVLVCVCVCVDPPPLSATIQLR